jgi:hypothetical protein
MSIIFIIGIILITISLTKAHNPPEPPKTIYTYVPRTFIEDQENPIPLDDIFYSMFNSPDPYVLSVDVERRKRDIGENINKYYVSAI